MFIPCSRIRPLDQCVSCDCPFLLALTVFASSGLRAQRKLVHADIPKQTLNAHHFPPALRSGRKPAGPGKSGHDGVTRAAEASRELRPFAKCSHQRQNGQVGGHRMTNHANLTCCMPPSAKPGPEPNRFSDLRRHSSVRDSTSSFWISQRFMAHHAGALSQPSALSGRA